MKLRNLNMDIDDLRTCAEVGEILKVSIRRVRKYINDGELQASKPGDTYLIPAESVQDLLRAKFVTPKPKAA